MNCGAAEPVVNEGSIEVFSAMTHTLYLSPHSDDSSAGSASPSDRQSPTPGSLPTELREEWRKLLVRVRELVREGVLPNVSDAAWTTGADEDSEMLRLVLLNLPIFSPVGSPVGWWAHSCDPAKVLFAGLLNRESATAMAERRAACRSSDATYSYCEPYSHAFLSDIWNGVCMGDQLVTADVVD